MNSSQVFTGLTILGACACGAGGGLATVSGALGWPAPSGIFYASLLAAGGALFLWGLRRTRALLPAMAACGLLLAASLLAPPRVMSDSVTHTAANLVGFSLYFVAAAAFVYTLLQLYQLQGGSAGWMALSSAVLAIGCTCCLTPGALRYTGLQLGLPSWPVSRLALVLAAFALGTAGFWLAGRGRGWAFFAAGIALVYPVEKAVEWLVPSLQVGSANLVFLLRYPVWLAGTALVFWGAAHLLRRRRPATV